MSTPDQSDFTPNPYSYKQPLVYRLFAIPSGWILGKILGILTRMRGTPPPRTRGLLLYQGRILLIMNITNNQRWTLPGGGYEAAESATDCFIREVSEELHLTIMPSMCIELPRQVSTSENGFRWRYDCVAVEFTRLPEIRLNHELLRAAWFPVDNLPTNRSTYIDQLLVKR